MATVRLRRRYLPAAGDYEVVIAQGPSRPVCAGRVTTVESLSGQRAGNPITEPVIVLSPEPYAYVVDRY